MLKVRVKGMVDPVTIVGSVPSVAAGEYVEAVGYWKVDSNFGRQFQARQLLTVAPTTVEGIERYLASGMMKGVGPHFAMVLVTAFGADVFEVIEDSPERLFSLKGIGPKRAARIVGSWAEQKKIREIMVFLHSYGVGTSRAVRIYRTYGESAIAKVSENPYVLARDIRGIGFRTADELAMRLGISPTSMMRAQAGISYVINEFCELGNCAMPFEDAIQEAAQILEIPIETLGVAADKEIFAQRLIRQEISQRDCLYLAPLYYAEIGVAANIKRLMAAGAQRPWVDFDASRAIAWVEARNGVTLSGSQSDALRLAFVSKVVIITGGPGVGKTTLVNSLLAILEAKRVKILLCAPTGRAAKRMTEATRHEAKTIHRTLAFDWLTFDFKHNQENPLDCDMLIVDEASMVDVVLMNRLLGAIPDRAALCIVGDVDQLPSVGPGAVLGDLIESGSVPTVVLSEVFRQAAESMIIQNAHRINSGQMPIDDSLGARPPDFYLVKTADPIETQRRLVRLVCERIPARFGFDPLIDIQVLTPMNRGGLGARALNVVLQEKLNGGATEKVEKFGVTFAVGDKVLQVVNDYPKEVYNGDIGVVVSLDREAQSLSVEFDANRVTYDFAELDELQLAYATTIHKSQGSEYRAVVIPISTQHYAMLERKLLYTAVTRAKELVVIVGDPRAMAIAVKNYRATVRVTGLIQRLTFK